MRAGRRRIGVVVGLAALLVAFVVPVRGALPPRYGGVLRLPLMNPVRLPEPAQINSAFEASLAHAVFDTLYACGPQGPTPVLANSLPEQIAPGVWRIELRENVARHDRRVLRPADVVRSFRRVAASDARWWMAPIARDPSRPVIRVQNHGIEIETGMSRSPAAAFCAGALAVVVGSSIGTGPYRARVQSRELRLVQFRQALRGAPYLQQIRLLPPTDRESELRHLELGELDGSWQGGSLYGDQQTRELLGDAASPVLLIPNPRSRSAQRSWGDIARRINRARFSRLGIAPSPRIAATLPAPQPPAGREPSSGPLRLIVRAGVPREADLAAALAAHLDELGRPISVVTLNLARYQMELAGDRWDLRLTELAPRASHPATLLAGAFAALGEIETASQIWAAAYRGDDVSGMARQLPAVVLGHRAAKLHMRPQIEGLRFDSLGRLLVDEAHLPRISGTR